MVHFRIFTMSQSEKARKLKAILSSILNEDDKNEEEEEEKPGPSQVKEGLCSACVCTMFTLHTCMDIRRKVRF